MIAGKWFVTPHAVHRYIERMAPELSYEQALGRLVRMVERAHFVKARDGIEQWRCGRADGRLWLRVSRVGPGAPQLLTVLPECSDKEWRL